MSKLKRAFTIIMCALLTIPTCLVSKPNNVYAAIKDVPDDNILLAEQTANACNLYGATASNNKTTDIYNLNDYMLVQFHIYLKAHHSDLDTTTLSVKMYSVDKGESSPLFSIYKATSSSTYHIEDDIIWNLKSLREQGEDLSQVYFKIALYANCYDLHDWGGITWSQAQATVGAIEVIPNPTPTFKTNSYVQSNGNLTRPCAYIVFV